MIDKMFKIYNDTYKNKIMCDRERMEIILNALEDENMCLVDAETGRTGWDEE